MKAAAVRRRAATLRAGNRRVDAQGMIVDIVNTAFPGPPVTRRPPVEMGLFREAGDES